MGRYTKRLSACGCLALAATTAVAQSAIPAQIMWTSSEGARVTHFSDQVVKGLMLGEPPNRLDLSNLHVWLPASPTGRKLCFVATTIDGVFRGQATIPLPRDLRLPGLVAIKVTPYVPLQKYRPEHFAARFALADGCEDTRHARWVPVAFGTQPVSTVRVLVQAGTVPPVAVVSTGLGDVEMSDRVRCTPIEHGRKTSFDHECRLPFDARFAGEKELRVYVHEGKSPRPHLRGIHVR
jgi:hypothetical protein